MKNSTRIQLLIATVLIVGLLSGCTAGVYEAEIGSGIGSGWFQWIVEQVADFTVWISELAGGYYWVGLIVVTLIVRTAGWPIYAKSNAMTIKMQQAQPELDKIKEKYQGKTDETSQRKSQAETIEVYRKYKINPLGCLLPFLQMPIFIAMYQVVRRIPLSDGLNGGSDYSHLNYGFLWIKDLGAQVDWLFGQKVGDPTLILPLAVAVLMFMYQRYSMKKPEYLNNKKFQSDQQNQTQKTMKMMSYFMVIMLFGIAVGNAGIALYWIVGNAYQFLQTYLNRRKSSREIAAQKSVI